MFANPLHRVVVRRHRGICYHDDVIKWKHFPRYWPLVRGIHRSPVNSPHKGQWRRALMFSLICVWINAWICIYWGWWLETSLCSLWRHCNDWHCFHGCREHPEHWSPNCNYFEEKFSMKLEWQHNALFQIWWLFHHLYILQYYLYHCLLYNFFWLCGYFAMPHLTKLYLWQVLCDIEFDTHSLM